jgi:hypothetical protein
VPPVTSFAEQARAFEEIVARVLGKDLEDRPELSLNERHMP